MFLSAIEVFPKECMGCLCHKQKNKIEVAIPYQYAKRKTEEVYSTSAIMFEGLLGIHFKKTCDYHSHTRTAKREVVEPSETDIQGLSTGMMEVIVQIRRTTSVKHYLRCNPGETISMSWGRYRGIIAAFIRIINPLDKTKTVYYKRVGLVLER